MTAPASLAAALADRYQLERDLGQGAARLLMTLNWFGELERQLGSR